MQLQRETTMMNFNALDRIENGNTFIGTEIFPAVLHSMLDEVEEKGYSHIVSWQPHGRCFVVHNRKEFVQFIMPAYFRMSKFASFQRQLNLYDFKRITAGPDKGGYYHENFVRGRKGLCKYILRQQVKGTLTRKPDPENEPDFYRLSMTRRANTEKVYRHSEVTTSSVSEVVLNAARAPIFQGTAMLPSKQGYSNAGGVFQQPHAKMTLDDLQGPAQSLLVAMRSAPGYRPLSNSLPQATTHHHTAAPPHEFHNPEPGYYNRGNESVVAMLRQPRYGMCDEAKAMLQFSNNQEQPNFRSNESVVSMLHPSRYTARHEENTQRFMHMNLCMESQLGAEDQNYAKGYFGSGIESNGCDSFPTTYFPALPSDADEPIGLTDSNAFVNEGTSLDWISQKAYH